MSRDLIVTNARVVTRNADFPGSVRVVDGHIVEIDPGWTDRPGAVDFGGDILMPGLIELHTDVLEKHLAPRPGVQWPFLAAVLAYDAQLAVAGITTVLDSLAVGYLIDGGQRPRDPRPLVEAVQAARAASARATPGRWSRPSAPRRTRGCFAAITTSISAVKSARSRWSGTSSRSSRIPPCGSCRSWITPRDSGSS